MHRFSRIIVSRLLVAGLCAPLVGPWLQAQTSAQAPAPASGRISAPQISVRTVRVLGSKDAVEIEVESSDRIVPQTQVLTRPDRLVVDFPNAVPSDQLRSQSVDRGEVKDLRIGLFHSKPPVTRVVLDLKTAQSYQIFPYGRTVIIKIMGGAGNTSARGDNSPSALATRPSLVVANYATRAEPARVEASVQPVLDVTFRDGLLGIKASKVTLSEVLFAVQQRTGAQIAIAAGAEQEQVVADIAPAPAPEVLARLLNGSKFNFLILSSPNDPQRLDRVILSPRPEGEYVPQPTPPARVQNDDPEETEPVTNQPAKQQPPPYHAPAPVPQQPEIKLPPDANAPDQ
ncbi:MAG TPA: AMIN domain-containing protein [Candidatus Sulfotelmatobacter sp.]|nr:AMIN domain-containing protein [Candidatus Sulfotelmatobacter sp.]